MTKTQIKSLSDAITQTNANEKTRNTFTVQCDNAYFTPDGYIGYEIPMEILYQAEEAHGITIPEASGSTTVSNTFSETSWNDYQKTHLNAKEFLAELKAFYKEIKKTLLTPETAVYKIKFKDKIHGYRIGLMINMLTVMGNNAEIYIEDERFGNMYVVSDIGKAVLLPVTLPYDATANKTI